MFCNHCPALSPYYKIQFLLTNKVDTEDSMCNKVVLFNTNIQFRKRALTIIIAFNHFFTVFPLFLITKVPMLKRNKRLYYYYY